MGVRFEWANGDHIVMYCIIEHPWTWQQYQAAIDVMTETLRLETHPVATIVDVVHMGSLPKEGKVMQNLQRVEELMPDNVFGSVIVGAPHVIVVFMNVLTQIRPKAREITMFANSLEEAHQMIAKRYESLAQS